MIAAIFSRAGVQRPFLLHDFSKFSTQALKFTTSHLAIATAALILVIPVLGSVIGMIAWAVLGTGVLFYSAGLAAIPDSHIEAATKCT